MAGAAMGTAADVVGPAQYVFCKMNAAIKAFTAGGKCAGCGQLLGFALLCVDVSVPRVANSQYHNRVGVVHARCLGAFTQARCILPPALGRPGVFGIESLPAELKRQALEMVPPCSGYGDDKVTTRSSGAGGNGGG